MRILVGPVLGALAVGAAAQSSLVLSDVTQSVGIDWVQVDPVTMMGAGGAFLDYDGDGWMDVLLSGGDSTPKLYRNTMNGASFVPVANAVFPPAFGDEGTNVTVGDIDNDGDPDVFFGRRGFNLLFRNDGGGVFTDITTPTMAGEWNRFTTSAAFGDFDSDGNLDLYVGNYIIPGSIFPNHTPEPNRIYRGHGDGTFTEITTPMLAGAGCTLATAWTDFDDDGDVDMMVANDFGDTVLPNKLYRNDGATFGGWQWTEVSAAMDFDIAIYCMGIAIGDIDRDLDFDYYFTNLGRNVLLRNDGSSFADITTASGTELTFDPDTVPELLATSWGTGFADFDCDGWLDLYVSNGHIPAAPFIANGTHTRNVLYRHDGPSMTFTEVASPLDNGIGRGAAFADYDNDGDVDILQVNINGAPVLMRNDSALAGHWMKVRLFGRQSNCDGLGARIDAHLGDWIARREVSRNFSYQASSEPAAHFGLGDVNSVERLHVRWPSGTEQDLHGLGVDRPYQLIEPVVTVSEGEDLSLDFPGGKWFSYRTKLRNETGTARTAYYQPQIRVGGITLWAGAPDVVTLAPYEWRSVWWSQFVPATSLPLPPGLQLVWVAMDAGFGVDEDAMPIGG